MGGIIASSPELLGTVQKFQDAGPVVPSTFLVQLPGLVGGNEFLQLTAAELQLLNQKQPGLMSSEGVMIQEATPDILSTLNPAQINTTSNLNIKRMFTDLGVELPQAQAPVETEGFSFFDTIKSYFTPSEESSGSSEPSEIVTTEGVLSPSSPDSIISGPFANVPRNYGTGLDAAQLNAMKAGYVSPSVTPGEQLLTDSNVSTEDLILSANEGDGAAADELQRRINQINEADVTDPDKTDPRRFGGVDPSFQDGSKYTPKGQSNTGSASPIASAIAESEFVADVKDVFVGGKQIVITPNVLKEFNLTKEDIPLDSLITERELKNLAFEKNKPEDLKRASESTSEQSPAQQFRDKEKALVDLKGGLNTMSYEDYSESPKNVAAAAKFADEKNPQGPNFVFDPDKIKKDLDEGGSGSNALLNTNKKLSPKESVKEFQAMYKEMLGMDDKDKEKEKWHQMAMIGFAIAAGQDPSALANIAGGLLEGTKMMKADRVRKQEREDKFTMMAIQSADEERRSIRDADARVAERVQDQINAINLLEKRGEISAEAAELAVIEARRTLERTIKGRMETEAAKYDNVSEKDKYLASESGKAAMAVFNTVYQDAAVSEKDKLSTIAKRLQPAAAAEFQSKTGIRLTGGVPGVGQGVTAESKLGL